MAMISLTLNQITSPTMLGSIDMESITVEMDNNKDLVTIIKSSLIPKRRPQRVTAIRAKVNQVHKKKMTRQSINLEMLRPNHIKLENL